MLSDNKGIGWHSGAYGGELSSHVLGAMQIYHHTGDLSFLKDCYEGYFCKVFWKRISGYGMNQFEVAEALEQMARLTGHEDDVSHWQKIIPRDPEHIRRMFQNRWSINGHENFFLGPKNGMLMTNGFWSMRSRHFPREYAEKMVQTWAIDKERGFFGEFFPLAMAKQSMQTFASNADLAFGYTPDTAYFTLDGMFRQGIAKHASELTLNHLVNYNYYKEWGVPVAPEAYRRDKTLFGDQYSNFNAGKILLYLEGLAGISYSLPNDLFSVRDAMPTTWNWMELEIPMMEKTVWTKVRIERQRKAGETRKTITIENCPLQVVIEPWLEEKKVGQIPLLKSGALSEIKALRPSCIAFKSKSKGPRHSVSVSLSKP